MAELNIAGHLIGDNHPPIIIAEIGINHGGSLEAAIDIADAAISSGALFIKHQTHIVEDEMSEHARHVVPGNASKSIYEIMENCALNEEDEFALAKYILNKGCIYLSTPFSRAAANRLESMNVPAYKIGSGECNNYPLIRHIARFKKPIILSTGMNSIKSIMPAVDIFREFDIPFALLHCTNVYPTPPELVRLGALRDMRDAFPDAVLGLSDHTVNNYSSFAAVALGAAIIERHFTDTKTRVGPDISCSMDPDALEDLIKGSNEIYLSLGGRKEPALEEEVTIKFAYSSVVAIKDIMAGELFTTENIWVKRPGGGDFPAAEYENIVGRKSLVSIKSGEWITNNAVFER